MICRSYQCIFVHIPKAAGRSVEMYFIKRLGLDRDNEEDRQELLLVDNDDAAKGTEKLSHLSALEYVKCGHVSQLEFDQFFKFSFVRNPWSRLTFLTIVELRTLSFASFRVLTATWGGSEIRSCLILRITACFGSILTGRTAYQEQHPPLHWTIRAIMACFR